MSGVQLQDERRHGFVMVYKSATQRIRQHFNTTDDCKVRTSTGLAVYMALAELVNDTRHSPEKGIYRARIAEFAGVSSKAVSDTLPHLAKCGVIEIERQRAGNMNAPNVIALLDTEGDRAREPAVPEADTVGASPKAPSVSPMKKGNSEEGTAKKGDTPLPPMDEITLHRLFKYWQDECDHPQAIFTEERKRKLRARLKDGYTPNQIGQAIQGAARNAWVSEDGLKHDGFDLIVRNGSMVEKFIQRHTAVPKPTGASAPRGNSRVEREDALFARAREWAIEQDAADAAAGRVPA